MWKTFYHHETALRMPGCLHWKIQTSKYPLAIRRVASRSMSPVHISRIPERVKGTVDARIWHLCLFLSGHHWLRSCHSFDNWIPPQTCTGFGLNKSQVAASLLSDFHPREGLNLALHLEYQVRMVTNKYLQPAVRRSSIILQLFTISARVCV